MFMPVDTSMYRSLGQNGGNGLDPMALMRMISLADLARSLDNPQAAGGQGDGGQGGDMDPLLRLRMLMQFGGAGGGPGGGGPGGGLNLPMMWALSQRRAGATGNGGAGGPPAGDDWLRQMFGRQGVTNPGPFDFPNS